MCLAFIHLAQGFSSQVSQYKIIKDLPDNGVNDRFLVRHRVTRELFCMKLVPYAAADSFKAQAMAEVRALQACYHIKEVFGLVDLFEDSECTYVITESASNKLTLTKYLALTYG